VPDRVTAAGPAARVSAQLHAAAGAGPPTMAAAVAKRNSPKRMQAQFLAMEAGAQGGVGGSVDIRKHRQQIMKLTKMNEIIAQELATETKLAAVNNSSTAAAKLATLREQKEMYQNKISTEKKRISEMDKQLAILRKNIIEKKKDIGGEHAAAENYRSIQKRIKILENQLDKALIRFNQQQTSNAELSQKIESLRKEQKIAEQLHQKLERELAAKKDQMQDIIEEAEYAFSEREFAEKNIANLKTGAESEQQQFLMEWQQLGGMVEHDRTQKRGFAPVSLEVEEEEPVDEETVLKKQVVRAHWKIAFEHAKQEVNLKKVHMYEEAFNRIKDVTGIQEVDELVETFVASEDQFNSLANLINELSSEVQHMEKELQDTKGLITEQLKGADTNMNSIRLRALQDLEEKLEKAGAKTQHFEDKFSASTSTVQELIPGVLAIFEQLGCPKMAEASSLVNEDDTLREEIKPDNMEEFLALIESKALAKLQQYAQMQARALDIPIDQLLVARPFTEAHQGAAVWEIEPPTIDEDDDSRGLEDDEAGGPSGDMPYTRSELQARARAKVAKDRGGVGGKLAHE
jgi:chromosome segregation ATPase